MVSAEQIPEIASPDVDISNEIYQAYPHVTWLAVSSALEEATANAIVSAAFGIAWHNELYKLDRYGSRPPELDYWKAVMNREMTQCRSQDAVLYQKAKCLSREVFRLFYTLDELTSPSFVRSLKFSIEI